MISPSGPAILLTVIFATGCGKPAPPADPLNSLNYREWKGGQVLRQVPAAGFAPTIPGRLDVHPPEGRSRRSGDFCDVYLNGEPLMKFNVAKMADGTWPRCGIDLVLRTGPNWIDLFDSSSDRNYRHTIDTREGTLFAFVPTTDGYELQQTRKE